MELNRQQLESWARIGFAVSGPMGALIIDQTGMKASTYSLWEAALLYVGFPVGSMAWAWIRLRRASQVKAVRNTPGVATVVIKDDATGSLAKLAADPSNSNIVTESQNAQDKRT